MVETKKKESIRALGPVDGARAFAEAAHAWQSYGGNPYMTHIREVALIAAPFGEDAEVVAYLHDAVEDSSATLDEVEEIFGAKIRAMVAVVSDDEGAEGEKRPSRAKRKAEANERFQNAGPSVYPALIAKVADRTANVESALRKARENTFWMYEGEHEAFRASAYREGLCEPLWERLEHAFEYGRGIFYQPPKY